ncbi:hypothetical protein KVR01_006684 [Diaporthe batatas]|uniref:uncharacterized protein n=1 Tax=Diaporthe batatas TaxID=748121 RepID=UPI001D048F1F|nr:uncharacterized protein KVR01_006684 [Diaporthe batatas]KAG8163387.1 hypothetical protein KVR01_006684 [Diaporthe batatas]
MAAPQNNLNLAAIGTKAHLLSESQAYSAQKFHYYRNGIPGYELTYWDIQNGFLNGDPVLTQRWNDIQARNGLNPPPVPALARFQFTANHRDRLRTIAVNNRLPLRAMVAPPNAPIDRRARQTVAQEYTTLYPRMRATFRYFKCLGWGGEGITSLWRYSPGPGQNHMVVMKMSTSEKTIQVPNARRRVIDTEHIDKERKMISQLGRAPHIVQRFYTAHHPRNINPNNARRSARRAQAVAMMAQAVDSQYGSSYFFMEYCKLGDLEAQLRRAARDGPNGRERYLPEPVLWRFFDCLVKGAMAMEEPPMQNTVSQTLPTDSRGDFLPEQITANNQGREGIVHMDLEQFAKDWDLVPRYEDPSDTHSASNWPPPWMPPWGPPPPITSGPARYSAASNVWHIGLIIKTALTLLDPDMPPYAGRMTSAEPPNVTPTQERWTYGWSLLDPLEPWATNNMYSQALRDVVAECLMAKQEHRPTLNNLQQRITQQLAMAANQVIPQYWTNTFFREPRRPRQPPPDTADVDTIDPFWDYENAEALQ